MAQPVLGEFDLAAEIQRFAPDAAGSGRRAETLIKHDRLRVVLVTMCSGAALHEYLAPGPITIQALRGRLVVTVGDDEREIAAGSIIAIEVGVWHAVHALDDGAFLLTIGGSMAPV